MTDDNDRQRLLASSYHVSAARILSALAQRWSPSSSQTPTDPPIGSGEVIGLCGQSGRHPYFRVDPNALRDAAQRIFNGGSIDDISAACRDLRQQVHFDSGTGCVNDSVPSMVPMLPPEEIWLDGRELPLDVWRLISFEFDLVSSAVASHVTAQDFAFAAVNQHALAFRYLVDRAQMRRVRFDVGCTNIPPSWKTAPSQVCDVSLARILFEAGALLTPLAQDDLARWYTAVRYLHWIDETTPDLRVQDRFDGDSVDSRYRGVFAEEIAVGLMAVVLSDVFGAAPINNTVEALPAGAPRGGGPMADFIARAANPGTSATTTIIAESKGSLRSPISKKRRDRAKQQVSATRVLFSASTNTLPLTFGSTVCFASQVDRTRCLVDDPPEEGDSQPVVIDEVDAWRVAYAKTLRFVGLESASRQVLRGEPTEGLREFDFDRNRDRKRTEQDLLRLHRAAAARERFSAELVLDAGPCAVSVEQTVLRVLRRGIDAESAPILASTLAERRAAAAGDAARGATGQMGAGSFEASLGIGCLWYEDLDGDRRGRRE